jgi:hypothetical protein
MIMQRAGFTNGCSHLFAILAFAGVALLGCSKDDPVGDTNPLCAGESGVGYRVEGRSSPLDVCVSDSAVDALLTSGSHYDIVAAVTDGNGNVFQLRMVLTQRPDAPVTLRLVNTVGEATGDPDAAYVHYTEQPSGNPPIETSAILGGKFRLTFSDDKVAVGTLESISMDMKNSLNGDPAGSRKITEGFFSVSVSPPVSTDVTRR